MKRHTYKGYVIDTDNLGRPYIYNTASQYSEDSDHVLVYICNDNKQLAQIKAIIDDRVDTGRDTRHADIDPVRGIIVY